MSRHEYLFRVNSAYLFKKLRVDRGLGLADAQQVTGVHANQISRVEGSRHFAKMQTYIRLLCGYGLLWETVFNKYETEPTAEEWEQLNIRAKALGLQASKQTRQQKKKVRTIKKKKRRTELNDDFMGF